MTALQTLLAALDAYAAATATTPLADKDELELRRTAHRFAGEIEAYEAACMARFDRAMASQEYRDKLAGFAKQRLTDAQVLHVVGGDTLDEQALADAGFTCAWTNKVRTWRCA